MLKKGFFSSLEGVEGVGKSTLLSHVKSLLDARGIDYIVTREPGGTPMAESIRRILLDQYDETVSDVTELLLMFASRSQNVSEVILPALSSGKWVIADRFTDASFAYQGGGRGLDLSSIEMLARLVQGSLQPDLTLLLDAPVEVGLARVSERGEHDRIELEKKDFFRRVREQYLTMAKDNASRYRVIDAERPLDEVKRQVSQVMKTVLHSSRRG